MAFKISKRGVLTSDLIDYRNVDVLVSDFSGHGLDESKILDILEPGEDVRAFIGRLRPGTRLWYTDSMVRFSFSVDEIVHGLECLDGQGLDAEMVVEGKEAWPKRPSLHSQATRCAVILCARSATGIVVSGRWVAPGVAHLALVGK